MERANARHARVVFQLNARILHLEAELQRGPADLSMEPDPSHAPHPASSWIFSDDCGASSCPDDTNGEDMDVMPVGTHSLRDPGAPLACAGLSVRCRGGRPCRAAASLPDHRLAVVKEDVSDTRETTSTPMPSPAGADLPTASLRGRSLAAAGTGGGNEAGATERISDEERQEDAEALRARVAELEGEVRGQARTIARLEAEAEVLGRGNLHSATQARLLEAVMDLAVSVCVLLCLLSPPGL
jgi:hypothetical protein